MQPNFTVLGPSCRGVSEWAGGKTAQLAIAPPDALYQSRDFLWRLSSATVELDQSDFTPLPGYTRLISVLEGEMQLFPEGGSPVFLAPFELYSFDGATPILSKGRCTDFNLMLRKGGCEGSLQSCRMGPGGSLLCTPAVPSPLRFSRCTTAVYCVGGSVSVSAGGAAARLEAGVLLLAEELGGLPLGLSCREEAALMIAQIWF